MLASASRLAALALVPLGRAGPTVAQVWDEPAEVWPPGFTATWRFGRAVDLSGDTLVVSQLTSFHPGAGCVSAAFQNRVHIMRRDLGGPGAWGVEASLDTPVPSCAIGGGTFGQALAIEGDTLAVGSPGYGLNMQGIAFVFERDRSNNSWSLAAQLDPPSTITFFFGESVAVSGDTVIVGSYGQLVAIYERNASGAYILDTVLPPGPELLFGSAVGLDADTLAVGAGSAGAGPGSVYVFERDLGGPGNWGTAAVVTSSSPVVADNFGTSLALDGDRLAVGSLSWPGTGVHVFERNAGGANAWGLLSEIRDPAAPSGFGRQLDLSGDTLIVSASEASATGGFSQTYSPGPDPSAAWILTGEFFPEAGTTSPIGEAVAIEGNRLALTSTWASFGSHHWTYLESAAFDPLSGLLYSAGTYGLVSFDPVAGTGDFHGQLPAKTLATAFDPDTATLYATLTAGPDQLVILDPTTAQATNVGPIDAGGHGFNSVQGLAFHPALNVLYGVDRTTDQLLTIDTSTGAGTPVGPLGGPGDLRSLACDPATGVLYSVDETQRSLFAIDPGSGQATLVGPISVVIRGLTWDSNANALLGVGTGNQPLVQVDPLTGSYSILHYMFLPSIGRTDVYERVPAMTYCSAGTSSGGCQAALASYGLPSASATAPFLLRADGFEGAQPSVLFYGTSGRQAKPWGNGTSFQCVAPPVTRVPALAPTGTTGACDAAVEVDLNALWLSHPAKYPVPGAAVQTQLWYLDPANTSNQGSALSGALEFHTAP